MDYGEGDTQTRRLQKENLSLQKTVQTLRESLATTEARHAKLLQTAVDEEWERIKTLTSGFDLAERAHRARYEELKDIVDRKTEEARSLRRKLERLGKSISVNQRVTEHAASPEKLGENLTAAHTALSGFVQLPQKACPLSYSSFFCFLFRFRCFAIG